jgi:hypothetical protein
MLFLFDIDFLLVYLFLVFIYTVTQRLLGVFKEKQTIDRFRDQDIYNAFKTIRPKRFETDTDFFTQKKFDSFWRVLNTRRTMCQLYIGKEEEDALKSLRTLCFLNLMIRY